MVWLVPVSHYNSATDKAVCVYMIKVSRKHEDEDVEEVGNNEEEEDDDEDEDENDEELS